MNQTLKPIPGYDGYFATASGEIWSGQRKELRRLKTRVSRKKGYCFLRLQVNKKRKMPYVHTLVLLAFIGPKPVGQETRHLNGIKTDNRLENLCWGTPKENTSDRIAHGTQFKPSVMPWTRLTADDVQLIRSRLAAGAGIRELAREFGVNPGTIHSIKSNKSWAGEKR